MRSSRVVCSSTASDTMRISLRKPSMLCRIETIPSASVPILWLVNACFGRELGKAFLHLGAYLPQMLQSKIVRFLSHSQDYSTE
jgi:hypothetical protein